MNNNQINCVDVHLQPTIKIRKGQDYEWGQFSRESLAITVAVESSRVTSLTEMRSESVKGPETKIRVVNPVSKIEVYDFFTCLDPTLQKYELYLAL